MNKDAELWNEGSSPIRKKFKRKKKYKTEELYDKIRLERKKKDRPFSIRDSEIEEEDWIE